MKITLVLSATRRIIDSESILIATRKMLLQPNTERKEAVKQARNTFDFGGSENSSTCLKPTRARGIKFFCNSMLPRSTDQKPQTVFCVPLKVISSSYNILSV